MFERYTEGSRRAFFLAKNEASQDKSQYLETEHLLQGVITADVERIVSLITRASRDSIQEKVLRAKKIYHGGPGSGDIPLSNESKRVFAYAADEADHLHSASIEVEHLLLGLMREPKSVAGHMLQEQGLKIGDLREKLGGPAELPAAEGFMGKLRKMFGGAS